MPIAKGIGGGFPIGACLVNKKVATVMKPGSHGTTFGGNPLAMSVGNAVLDVIFNKNFLKNVRNTSRYFKAKLNNIQLQNQKVIKEVRGTGLLLGHQVKVNRAKFIEKLMREKLLTIRAAENVVRILPPLNVSKKEIDQAVTIINKVCKSYK